MTCIKTATVSDKGQISISLDIRDLMGIEKGDSLILIANEDEILIKKSKDVVKKLLEEKKDYSRLVELSLKKDWDNDADERWNNV